MDTLENTYCKNTEYNLRRYNTTGWTHIDKLDDGEDFIVARMSIGREVCYKVGKDSNLLNHLKLIEDATPDGCYGIVGIKEEGITFNFADKESISKIEIDTNFQFPIGLTTGTYTDVNNHEKQYGESKIITLLEHILSRQVHLTGGSYINVDDMIKELGKFGFYPNPNGRKIDE